MAANNSHLLVTLGFIADDVLKGILQHIIDTGDYPEGVTFRQICYGIIQTLEEASRKNGLDPNLFDEVYFIITMNPKYQTIPLE